MRYIIIENLINESLSFKTILTKMTFVTTSVAGLMIDSTCFVLGLPLGTFFLAHILFKCHFEAFVALSKGYDTFYRNWTIQFAKPDHSVLTDLLCHFFFWTVNDLMAFFFASKTSSVK
jgi:hypothetical protein